MKERIVSDIRSYYEYTRRNKTQRRGDILNCVGGVLVAIVFAFVEPVIAVLALSLAVLSGIRYASDTGRQIINDNMKLIVLGYLVVVPIAFLYLFV